MDEVKEEIKPPAKTPWVLIIGFAFIAAVTLTAIAWALPNFGVKGTFATPTPQIFFMPSPTSIPTPTPTPRIIKWCGANTTLNDSHCSRWCQRDLNTNITNCVNEDD